MQGIIEQYCAICKINLFPPCPHCLMTCFHDILMFLCIESDSYIIPTIISESDLAIQLH